MHSTEREHRASNCSLSARQRQRVMHEIKTPAAPRQVLCFYPIELPTQEGDVYVFTAQDTFSEFVIQTGVEHNRDEDSMLKHIVILMQHEDFIKHNGTPFTLVLHKYEQIRTEIEAIIAPHGGTLVVDEIYLLDQMTDLMEHLFQTLAKGRQMRAKE